MKKTISPLNLSLAVILSMTAVSQAATDTWSGASSANWSDAGNWSPGAPNPGDSLIFAGTTQTSPNNDTATNTVYAGISFDSTATAGFDLLGNPVSFSGIIENDSTAAQSIDLQLALTSGATINVTNGSINIGLNAGGISGTGPVTVNGATGGGTLTVSNKTYSGGTIVNSGATMEVWNDNGSYTLAGGSLLLNYGSFYSGPSFAFTADSSLGVNVAGNYSGYGRYDCYGNIGSSGFKWTVIGNGRFQLAGGANHLLASSTEVTAPAVLSDINTGNATISSLGTNLITVDNGAALRKNNGGIVQNPIVLNGGDGPDHTGALVANQEAYSGQAGYTVSTFTGNITLNSDTSVGAQISSGNSYGASLALAGNITGAGGLNKIGAYPLILSGSNTYNGQTILNVGTLQVGSPNALPHGVGPNGQVQLNNSAVLDLNSNAVVVNGLNDDGGGTVAIDNTSASPATLTTLGSGYIRGPVKNTGGGALSIIVNGSGAFASFTGANTYSGSNVVQQGTLDINIPAGTTTGGLVSVSDGATLSLHYRVPNSPLQAAGASLLGVSSGVTLNVDLNNFGNPSKPVINATNGSGVLNATGTTTVTINNSGNMSLGQFPLIKYTSRTGTGNFVLNTISGGIVAQIVTNAPNSSIDIKVTSAPITTWVGNVNNLWNYTTTNWTYSGATLYSDGSAVFFGDSALTNNVNLTAALNPASVLVSTTNTYTFGGAGSLAGGTLAKNGSGTLVVTTAGNSPSTVTISGGTLQLGTNGTTGDLGSAAIDDEATLSFTLSTNLTFANVITGAGNVVQNDTNTLTLATGNGYTGGTLINQGVIKAGGTTALGVPATGVALATVASGAAFDVAGNTPSVTNAVVISGNGNGTANQGALFATAGWSYLGGTETGVNALSLAADATIGDNANWFTIGNNGVNGLAGNNHNLTKVGNNTIAFKASASSALASFTLGGGGLLLYNRNVNPFGSTATLIYSNNAVSDSWDPNSWTGVIVPNNIIIASNGGQIRNTHGAYYGQANQDNYNGTLTLNGPLTLQCSSTYNGAPNGQTYGRQNLNGAISGVGSITATIVTNDTVTLAGTNTYSGATIVTGGANGGTLKLSAVQQGGGTYTNNDNGTLDVPSQTGYPTVPMAALALGSTTGSTLSLSRVTSLSTIQAPITATNLVLTGANSLLLPALAFANGPGEYPLIKYTTLSGTGTIAVGGGVRGVPGYITNDTANSQIAFVIPGGSPVAWTGSASALWDINSSINWKTNGVATTYLQAGSLGDVVTFDDTSSVTNVNVSVPVSPTAAIFNLTNNTYTLFGTNLTGASSLVKNGPGILVLSNLNNNFTGGTIINGGTLKMFSAPSTALNNLNGTVTVTSGGTMDMGYNNPSAMIVNITGAGVGGNGAFQANYTNGAQAWGPSIVNLTGNATIGGNNRWDLRNGSKQLNATTAGTTLTKVGAGYVGLVAATVSTNIGDIYILNGTLSFQTSTTGVGDTNKTIYVGNGGNLGMYQFATPIYKSIVCSNGAGILIDGGNTVGQNVISGPFRLDSGTTTIKGNYYNGVYFSNSISGPGSLGLQFQSYVYLAASNTFTGTLTVPNCGASNGGRGTRLSFIGNGSAMTCSQIYLQGITSSQAYAGWISMDTPSATLTLGTNQQLRGDNGAYIRGSVVVPATASIAPGGINNSNYQYMIVGTNLTFQSGSTNYMDIYKAGLVLTNDLIIVSNLVTYGGTLQIQTNGGTALIVGDSFKLFQAASSSGNFANIADASGTTWSFNPATGIATVTALPVTASTNANLLTLALTPGAILTPAFNSNTLSYAASEPYGSAIAVTVTNADTTATNRVTINGNALGIVASGVASTPPQGLPVNPSLPNTVTVQVTAQDGVTVKTYTVNVTQIPSQTPPSMTQSVSGGTLTLTWPLANQGYRLLQQTNNLANGVSGNTNDWGTVAGSTATNTATITITNSILNEYYRLAYP